MKIKRIAAFFLGALMAIASMLPCVALAGDTSNIFYMELEQYLESEDFTPEGLKQRFPEYYAKYMAAYESQLEGIRQIEGKIQAFLEEGKKLAATESKGTETGMKGMALGTYGDILVQLRTNAGPIGLVGHAAIVSNTDSRTVEAYPKIFSPIKKEGVQYYQNEWRTKNGAILMRPRGAYTTKYRIAASFAEGKVGKPYNWNFFDWGATNKYYCSQLVWQAWLDAGFDIETGSPANGIIAPIDIVRSTNTYPVEYIEQ